MLPDKQRRVIEAALRAAEAHGFALGGNAALTAHGLPGFSTKVIDLVTPGRAIRDAAKAVEKELRSQGHQPERLDTTAERRHVLPPARGMLAQWSVPTGGKHDHPPIGGITKYNCEKCFEHAYLEMSRAPRSREPVRTTLGPAVHPEDAAGAKLRDLAERGRARDYADTARLMERWSPRQLTGFAQRLDPEIDPAGDLASRAARLAVLPDIALTGLGAVRPEQLARMREQFANWQRDPRDIARPEPARQEAARQRERTEPAREPRQASPAQRRPREAERDEPERTR
jgi:hypothetical protein